MVAPEQHGRDVAQSSSIVEESVTEAQVALEEGLNNYTTSPAHKHMLMDILEGLPSRPHECPILAAKGYKQYA